MHFRVRSRAGNALVEISVCIVVVIGLGIAGLRVTVAALQAQQWAVKQTLADAAIGIEEARAQRIPFANIATSPDWPTFPNLNRQDSVSLGKTSYGEAFGRVIRTKRGPTVDQNGNQSFQLEAYLRYEVFGRAYFKSRRVVRSQ